MSAESVVPKKLKDLKDKQDNDKKNRRNNLDNATQIISAIASLTLFEDTFTHRLNFEWNEKSGECTEEFILELTLFIQREFGFKKLSDDTVRKAVHLLAAQNKKNKAQEFLKSLPSWDKYPRIEHFFIKVLGADSSEYTKCAGSNFLKGLIKRIKDPGCKNDYMPVLEGPQGTLKSTVLRKLAGEEFYVELSVSPNSKDFFMALIGKLLVEISELSSFSRADLNQIKSAISCQVDRFRPPYGREPKDYPRQCVFVGTTNEDTYLKDQTGNRRFWPIRVGSVDLGYLEKNRDQILAEALYRIDNGEQWWQMPENETVAMQETRRQRDPWEEIVAQFLLHRPTAKGVWIDPNFVTLKEILDHLEIDVKNQNKAHEMRLADVLKRLGWARTQRGDDRVRGWGRIPEKKYAPSTDQNMSSEEYKQELLGKIP